MKSSVFKRLTTAQFFVALAGGLALYLTPGEAQSFLHTPIRELYVAGLAALIALIILVIFKSYEAVGISQITGMIFLMTGFLSEKIRSLIDMMVVDGKFVFDYQSGIIWGLVWMAPFLICMLVRIFSLNEWDTPQKHEDFTYFFRWASIAFYVLYVVLLVFSFILIRKIDLNGERQLNLIPFYQITQYFSSVSDVVYYLFGNLLFFSPIGFFLSVRHPKLCWWKKLLIAFGIGFVIEFCQYMLNTGMADIDDILLNAAGFYLGCGAKRLINLVRRLISGGSEISIPYYPQYLTPSPSVRAAEKDSEEG